MAQSNNTDCIIEQLMGHGHGNGNCNGSEKNNASQNDDSCTLQRIGQGCFSLTPSQIIVIIGIISGTLAVQSVLVDRDQTVNIVLTGSLKRQSEIDKMIEMLGEQSFSDVIASIMSNYR